MFGNGLSIDADGNYVIAGEARDKLTANRIGVGRLISGTDFSQLGVILCWLDDPTNAGIFNVSFKDVVPVDDGSKIFIGSTEFSGNVTAPSASNVLATQYNQIDNINTSGFGNYRTLGGPDDDEGFSVALNSSGNMMISGYQTNVDGDKDIFLAENQIPASDGPLWQNSFGEEVSGTASEDIAYGVYAVSDGYLIAGSTQRPGEKSQMYLAKTDESGNKLWSRSYGFIELDEAHAVAETSDGGYALFGTVTDERGNTNMCLIKTDTKGEIK